ncbi:translation initiation factor 2 [Streptomyces sp. N2-109]|uniref:Translation initiation factor 2 n=1 Tax=Streptomyces gossypii TaxID=2883101 RepID=A0ABT2JTU8_9ACTN|nr:translation initiation factor 2 [Streptomyces gossypii]MCT2590800.1 translation initiation factor 2 [Streptomyces gossypii]
MTDGTVLFAARSATALYRLLDVLPVFAGDARIDRRFTLVPGSDFGIDALAAIEHARARTIPWDEALRHTHDLILAASPKGELRLLRGTRALLPHGAGFSKSLRGEGSGDSASGLDPAYLLPDGNALASFHALAHPSQVAQLAAASPQAAARAAVVGDPTLERILASRDHRDRYRAALGTGARKLIVLTSTWGPESLFRRRPGLLSGLALHLPYDTYQLALVLHPNERSLIGAFDLTERLAPAIDAGMALAGPYEEWGALLTAADAVVTDHGSTALYAAALGCPLIGAYDGGDELIPGSPMAELLSQSPRLEEPGDTGSLEAALGAPHRPGAVRALADTVFAEQGRALGRLREELYGLLRLAPPPQPVAARLLPSPSPPARTPAAFAVRTEVSGEEIRVERLPAHTDAPAQYLAAEHGAAGEPYAQSAGLLYRRRAPQPAAAPHSVAWTAAGWTAHALGGYPGCRTAAAILEPWLCVVRARSRSLLSVRIEPRQEDGRVVRADPAAVLCAVHAWLAGRAGPRAESAELSCVIGGVAFRARLSPATADEAAHVLD